MVAVDHPGLQLECASSGSALERYVVVWSCAIAELKTASLPPDHFAPPIADLAERREGLREVMALDVRPWEDEFEPSLLRLSRRLSEPALEEVAAARARLIGQYRLARVAWVAGPITHHAAPRKRQVRASATATQRRAKTRSRT